MNLKSCQKEKERVELHDRAGILPGSYVAAAYIRLSNEDRDLHGNSLKNESNSVTNQRTLIHSYLESKIEFSKCRVVEFCDDGCSGICFETRPQLAQLMERVRKGEINCIIVKDFSRFGRNYVELGNYLEQVFPFLGVRFIAINDGYDSESLNGSTGGLDVAFKNLIYDLYSKDNSQKVKNGKKAAALKGECVAPYAVYGYKKSKQDKRKLKIDPQAAAIVKEIFELRVSGLGCRRIAKYFNDKGVPPPAVYNLQNGGKRDWRKNLKESLWSPDEITKIIRDERYTGKMVSLKTEKMAVGGRSCRKEESSWVRVDNTQEAIVTEALFRSANQALAGKKRGENPWKNRNIFYCGYCGRKMIAAEPWLYCPGRYLKSDSKCSEIRLQKKEAEQSILLLIKSQELLLREETRSRPADRMLKKREQEIRQKINLLRKTVKRLENTKILLYEKYKDGNFDRETYKRKKGEYEAEIQQETKNLEMLESEYSEINNQEDLLEKFLPGLTKEVKERLIEKVVVYPDSRVEIKWYFQDEYSNLA